MSVRAFSKKERKWIGQLQELLKNKPETVMLYSTDGEIVACKKGVSVYDVSIYVTNSRLIGIGCVLTDIHDDCNFGRGK